MRAQAGWALPVLLVIVAVIGVAWLVRRAEPRLAFFPTRGEDQTPQSLGVPFRALTIETRDGERLHAWHLPREAAQAQVVYFHGNGGNLSIWSDVLAGLWREGFDVIAVDYRGYGLSTGSPTEQGLYEDVDATLRHVRAGLRRPSLKLIYWGRSLGTSMAAYAATRHPPDGVILEAAFPSMRAILETNPVLWLLSWLSRYRFPTADWMASVRQPTLVLHGDQDRVIRYRLGQRLFASLSGPKTFVTIPGGDHNEAVPPDPGRYWQAIRTFVEQLGHAVR